MPWLKSIHVNKRGIFLIRLDNSMVLYPNGLECQKEQRNADRQINITIAMSLSENKPYSRPLHLSSQLAIESSLHGVDVSIGVKNHSVFFIG